MDKNNPNNLTQEQIKQGYSTILGNFDPLTGQTKPTTQQTGIDNFSKQFPQTMPMSNVITPASLVSQPKIDLPTIPTTTVVPQAQPSPYTEYLKTFDLNQKETQAQNIQNTGLDQYLKDIIGSQGETQAKVEELNKTNYSQLRQDLVNTDNKWKQLEAEKAQDDITLLANMRGEEIKDTLKPFAELGKAQLAGDAQIIRALKTSEQNMLSARSLALQGNIELAKETADNAVALKYAPYKDRIKAYEDVVKAIQPYLTSAEKKEAAKQTFKGDMVKKEIEKAENEEKKSNEYLTIAIQGKAPANLIAKAQDLINKGAKATEVAKALGNYSLSLADRLDIQLKQAQIDKTNKEINKLKEVNKDAGELVKINGKDYIRYKDGTISDPVLPEAADTTVVTTRLDNKLKTLDKLTKPSPGLAYSAGALRTPLGKPLGFINQINDWRADATNVIQKLTVDELGRVKSDGVTFGALSNGERQAVGDAATALGAASIRDKEGNPTGEFRMSEKKVIEEFNKIKQGYALDFERRTGMTYDQYLQNPEAVKQKAVDDFIDTAGTALINSNTYGGYPTN